MELLLLLAIAYAGARGIEAITDTTDKRHKNGHADKTVAKVAEAKTSLKKPKPTEPGGTFAAAAPRTASLGGKAAKPIAVGVETGAVLWRSLLEGYAKALPEARKEHRERMTQRAAKRKADKAEKAAPPKPNYPPTIPAPTPPADAVTPQTDTSPTTPPKVRHLRAITPQRGATMPATTSIPEIRTLDGLMNALALISAMCLMRSEEAQVIAADDTSLSNRLDALEAELAELEVDDATVAEIGNLRESIHAQAAAAGQYGAAAHDAGELAKATADAAYKAHGGIAEAVQSSPIERAAQAGYYDR